MSATTQATTSAESTTARPKRGRLYFVDNLRVFVILATVIHHAANPYAGDRTWFYKHPADQIERLISPLQLLTPSYSMAILLIFSGYLLAGSFERRSFGQYLWQKFLHLGIPLMIGFFIYIPLLQYWYHYNYRPGGHISFWNYYWHIWHGIGGKPDNWDWPGWPDRHLAHLWYIEHLLVYSILYGLWRYFFHPAPLRIDPTARVPGHRAIVGFAVFIALATWATRVVYPMNHVEALFGFLQVEVARYPIWLPYFFLGLIVYRRQWLTRLPSRIGRPWLAVGVGLAVFEYIYAQSGWWGGWGMFTAEADGGSLAPAALAQSLFKATWESFFCAGMVVGLIVLFREMCNSQGPLAKVLSENAYAVHIFHTGVLVILQELIAPLPWTVMSKFLFVVVAGGILSVLVSHYVIRRIPGATRVF